jgi:hypothetical protein
LQAQGAVAPIGLIASIGLPLVVFVFFAIRIHPAPLRSALWGFLSLPLGRSGFL